MHLAEGCCPPPAPFSPPGTVLWVHAPPCLGIGLRESCFQTGGSSSEVTSPGGSWLPLQLLPGRGDSPARRLAPRAAPAGFTLYSYWLLSSSAHSFRAPTVFPGEESPESVIIPKQRTLRTPRALSHTHGAPWQQLEAQALRSSFPKPAPRSWGGWERDRGVVKQTTRRSTVPTEAGRAPFTEALVVGPQALLKRIAECYLAVVFVVTLLCDTESVGNFPDLRFKPRVVFSLHCMAPMLGESLCPPPIWETLFLGIRETTMPTMSLAPEPMAQAWTSKLQSSFKYRFQKPQEKTASEQPKEKSPSPCSQARALYPAGLWC